ncbi:type II toxin-antitoxin system death-on-curing family toxin [Paracidobacterium acidisoli]|uniref:Type II toxin-antitoxin system death-on-curing family toxin n=1 Tax=Paracidobacterium acidisoli TaxID=2303751 RepID=A0A372IKB7_9BACT|nr:type II toxin-antitoxin system death-on-curing family toxin [Paracidobacterium acidisoli]MBT9332690.1 type II toxin-antitoxin system death-on-curing family toxin [Paracidobacterium acidisoli]
MDIFWITKEEALAIHRRQLSVHGGSDGIRDEGLLESALARPQNVAAYASEAPSLHRLAASLAFGIAKNHPFVDGNKRTAMVTSFTFLAMNGLAMTATQEEAYFVIYDLAAGQVTEDQLTAWFEDHSAPAEE